MKRVVFVRDKTNKHSIRALLAAYEKWFPEKDYYVLTPQVQAKAKKVLKIL